MTHRQIILTGYNAAKFLAENAFVDRKIDTEYISSLSKHILVKDEKGSVRIKTNPNYPYKTDEEERLARYKHEQKKREFIHKFLKDEYPDKDYAEVFISNDGWDKPLRYHNEETKSCKFLHEDCRHCNNERAHTTCYTCCFSCSFPEGYCNDGNCKFIK